MHALRGARHAGLGTRFWYISSAMNGVIGAISLVSVTRHSYSVR